MCTQSVLIAKYLIECVICCDTIKIIYIFTFVVYGASSDLLFNDYYIVHRGKIYLRCVLITGIWWFTTTESVVEILDIEVSNVIRT